MNELERRGLRLTEETLRQMADTHVFCEVVRLRVWSRGGVAEDAFMPHARMLTLLVGQATLECVLLHMRVVIAFLVNRRPTNPKYETDLVADDYFDEEWQGRPAYLLGSSKYEHDALMTELHRRLAHLLTQRLKDNTPEGGFNWQYVLVNAPAVLEGFKKFVRDLGELHPERVAWFDQTLDELSQLDAMGWGATA